MPEHGDTRVIEPVDGNWLNCGIFISDAILRDTDDRTVERFIQFALSDMQQSAEKALRRRRKQLRDEVRAR